LDLREQGRILIVYYSKQIADKYLSKAAMECFSRVKPSESRKTLTAVSKDLFNLITHVHVEPAHNSDAKPSLKNATTFYEALRP
jgi:hypothetical protein